MRSPLACMLLLTVLASALAGCAGDAPERQGGDAEELFEEGAGELDLAATATTGVIRGIVVDEAIRPVAGAKVTLAGGSPVEAMTTEGGAFGFDDLPAGTYFLSVHKLGYVDTQTSADVVAGIADPDIVRVLLVAAPGLDASYEVYHFQGFLECNAVAVIFFFPCEVPFVGPVGNDNYAEEYALTTNATWIHVSLVWEPTQPFGTELYFNLYEPGAYDIVAYTGGPSPQSADADQEALEPINEEMVFAVEVSGNGEQGIAGVEFQQGFDLFAVVFHNFVPPEGYAYHSDGDPVPPQ